MLHGQILHGFEIQLSGTQKRQGIDFPETIGRRNPEVRQAAVLQFADNILH